MWTRAWLVRWSRFVALDEQPAQWHSRLRVPALLRPMWPVVMCSSALERQQRIERRWGKRFDAQRASASVKMRVQSSHWHRWWVACAGERPVEDEE